MRNLFRMRLVLAGCIALSACGQPAAPSAGPDRNCSRGEGERHYKAYASRLKNATDWQKVGWIRQVAITKWIACQHKMATHHPLDDCLDKLSYFDRNASMAFSRALDQCIRQSKQRLSK